MPKNCPLPCKDPIISNRNQDENILCKVGKVLPVSLHIRFLHVVSLPCCSDPGSHFSDCADYPHEPPLCLWAAGTVRDVQIIWYLCNIYQPNKNSNVSIIQLTCHNTHYSTASIKCNKKLQTKFFCLFVRDRVEKVYNVCQDFIVVCFITQTTSCSGDGAQRSFLVEFETSVIFLFFLWGIFILCILPV